MSSFFFLLASLSLAFLCNSQADLIGDVCSKSINPSLCNRSLRSDPRSRGADLRGLGQISIDNAKAATQTTLKVANSLASGPDREKAKTCVETCGDAIDNLNQCRGLLNGRSRRSISDLQTKGSAALTDISTCDDEFGGSEPAKLKQASRRAQDLVDVLLVIANRL
ncbi:hypothetical protein Pfo_021911 [Paulownia fortunei]|nr:hypothetical protein Pfo_021911 [Paulownia fortunei]